MTTPRIPRINVLTERIRAINLALDAVENSFVNGIQTAVVTLVDAQIKALPSAPALLIAGVPGKSHFILMAVLALDTTAGAYTNIDSSHAPYAAIDDGLGEASDQSSYLADNTALGLSDLSRFFAGAVGKKKFVLVASQLPVQPGNVFEGVGYGSGMTQAGIEGQDVFFTVFSSDGNFTGGHAGNSMVITVLYVEV